MKSSSAATGDNAKLMQYRDGLDTLSDMWHYEERVSDLITNFQSSTARYRLTCENLLGPLILSNYEELLDHPEGTSWHDKELGRLIKTRLGSSYDAYTRLVQRLHKALLKFAEKMALEPANGMKVWYFPSKQNVLQANWCAPAILGQA